MSPAPWQPYSSALALLQNGTLDVNARTGWHMALFRSTSNAHDLDGIATLAELTDELQAGAPIRLGLYEADDGSPRLWNHTDVQWLADADDTAPRYAVIYWPATVGGVAAPLLCVSDLTPTATVQVPAGKCFTVRAGSVFAIRGVTWQRGAA